MRIYVKTFFGSRNTLHSSVLLANIALLTIFAGYIYYCVCVWGVVESLRLFKEPRTSCWNIAWFKTTVLGAWYRRESLSLMSCKRINTMIKHEWQLTHIAALPRTFNLDPEVEGAGKKKNAIIYYIVGFVYKTYR